MGRLPESSARKTEATNTERVERESRTTGTVKRWEVEEEKLREHLQIIINKITQTIPILKSLRLTLTAGQE